MEKLKNIKFVPIQNLIDKSEIDLEFYEELKINPQARENFINYISRKVIDSGIDMDKFF